MRHWKLLALLATWLILGAPVRAANVREVRLARHDEFVRCVVEMDGPPSATYRNESKESKTVSLELSGITGAGSGITTVGDLGWVTDQQVDYAAGASTYRLHLRTDREVEIASQTLGDPWRLVMDLYEPGKAPRDLLVTSSSPAPISIKQEPAPSAVERIQARIPSNNDQPVTRTSSRTGARPRIVVIDAGHGGHHRGGTGKANGRAIDEAQITLPIAFELEKLLKADPRFEPRMTRVRDEYVGLRERTRRAEQYEGDIFVSIHYNAVPKGGANSARGMEFWTWSPKTVDSVSTKYLNALDNEEGSDSDLSGAKRSAMPVLNQMVLDILEEQALESRRVAQFFESAFLRDPHFKKHYRGVKGARFKVLENYNMPSILIEVGFISNTEDARLSVQGEFQRKVARNIYDGLTNYYRQADGVRISQRR